MKLLLLLSLKQEVIILQQPTGRNHLLLIKDNLFRSVIIWEKYVCTGRLSKYLDLPLAQFQAQ